MIRNRKQTIDHHVRPVPRMRRLVVDQAWLALRKHMIRGLIEVDVTTARQAIRDHQAATGERLSFTAFLVACLGHTVSANRDLQAYQDWRGRLIVFEDVDIVTIVEIVADGHSFPLAHIVRAANRRKAMRCRWWPCWSGRLFHRSARLPGFCSAVDDGNPENT